MRVACLLASIALAASSIHAAPREGTLGGGKASGPVMSMAQLRACLAQQSRIQSQSDDTVKIQQQLKNDRAEIDRNAAALKDEMAALDRTSKEAVESYVAKAQAHDKSIDSYEAAIYIGTVTPWRESTPATYRQVCPAAISVSAPSGILNPDALAR